MHVTPGDLRPIRRDGLVFRTAVLAGAGFAIVELPGGPALRTSIESSCDREHWGYVIRGEATIVLPGNQALSVGAGEAFHLPAGTGHGVVATGGSQVAAFIPGADAGEVRDGMIGAPVSSPDGGQPSIRLDRPTRFLSRRTTDAEPRRVIAEGRRMGSHVFAQVRLGVESGYTVGYCDLPHWGMVLSGRLTIEWENDVAALAAGDVFHCPAGPPGHRFLGADPALLIDYTPVDAYGSEATRMAEWRATMARTVLASPASDVDAGFVVEVAQAG